MAKVARTVLLTLMPHEDGGALVLGDAAHRAAQPGLLREDVEQEHDDGADGDGVNRDEVQRDARDADAAGGEELARDYRVRAYGRYGLRQVLEKEAHGHGGYQRRHVVPLRRNGPVRDELNQHADQRADRDGDDDRRPGRKAAAVMSGTVKMSV